MTVSGRGDRAELVRAIYRVLEEIHDPCSVATSVPMGLAEMGLVKSVQVADDGAVALELRLTSPFCEMINYLRLEAERRLAELPGVSAVSVTHDCGLDWDHDLIAAPARRRRELRLLTLRQLATGEGAELAAGGLDR